MIFMRWLINCDNLDVPWVISELKSTLFELPATRLFSQIVQLTGLTSLWKTAESSREHQIWLKCPLSLLLRIELVICNLVAFMWEGVIKNVFFMCPLQMSMKNNLCWGVHLWLKNTAWMLTATTSWEQPSLEAIRTSTSVYIQRACSRPPRETSWVVKTQKQNHTTIKQTNKTKTCGLVYLPSHSFSFVDWIYHCVVWCQMSIHSSFTTALFLSLKWWTRSCLKWTSINMVL